MADLKGSCPADAPSELRVPEHLKHGVEHGQHDHLCTSLPLCKVVPEELAIICLDEHFEG